MYARVITAQYQPGKVDEAIQRYHEMILPEARQHKGFTGAMYLVDRSSDQAIGISLWQTEADLQASEERMAALGAEMAKVTSLAGAPRREMFEVVYQE